METPDYFLVERMRYDIVYILGRLFIKVDRVIVGVLYWLFYVNKSIWSENERKNMET